ncbi:MAG: hemolysin III family protein [Gammaproteobacteria bacterium]|nr:hemolysin III family protein [Gammaproteobacteria bacterium]
MSQVNTENRLQSFGEELANSISHGVGAIFALIAAPILVVSAVQQGDIYSIVGSSVFAATMIMLYLASTLYHALPFKRVTGTFQILDHIAIFLFIAGTYTPFALGVLRGAWGWTIFGLVWSIALAGIIMKLVLGAKYPKISTAIYLSMGWIAIIAIKPLIDSVLPWGMFWIISGGVAYTVGVIFFIIDTRLPYAHFVWHLFVLLGTVFHFIAVLGYST